MNIVDRKAMTKLFRDVQFEVEAILAYQASVKYSMKNSIAYTDTNFVSFAEILGGNRYKK